MDARFSAQPFVDSYALVDYLEEIASNIQIREIAIAVAWAHEAGVQAALRAAGAIQQRGGHARMAVGVSFGGTSVQALQAASEALDEVYIVTAAGRTFHPKLYAARGPDICEVFIGSNNLTVGGLETNFEAGVTLSLHSSQADDLEFATAVFDYFDRVTGDLRFSRRIAGAEDVLEVAERYGLLDEAATDETSIAGDSAWFKDELPLEAEEEATPDMRMRRSTPRSAPPEGDLLVTATAQEGKDRVARRWYKVLPDSDAQQLTGSHPSNTMTLVKGLNPAIREASDYFRYEFFSHLHWVAGWNAGRAQSRETAIAEFDVFIDRRFIGSYEFMIRYTPGYEANQRNRTTELVWGEFGSFLRERSLTGWYAIIEVMTSGRTRLHFERAAREDPIY